MPLVLEPSWVGRRVSVRRVLDHGPHGRPAFGDVVGDLVGLDAPDRRRRHPQRAGGGTPRARRARPPGTAVHRRRARAGGRRGARLRPAETARARRLAAARRPRLHPAGELGAAAAPRRACRSTRRSARRTTGTPPAGSPLRIHLPIEARRLLDAELGERGWPPTTTHVFAGPPGRHARARPGCAAGRGRRPSGRRVAGPLPRRPRPGRAPRAALLTRHDDAGFATLRADGRAVAIGRGAVDDGWLGVMAVEVDPAYRRLGLAGAVMAALWRWGSARGAVRSYLQVMANNTPGVDAVREARLLGAPRLPLPHRAGRHALLDCTPCR